LYQVRDIDEIQVRFKTGLVPTGNQSHYSLAFWRKPYFHEEIFQGVQAYLVRTDAPFHELNPQLANQGHLLGYWFLSEFI
jgi:hypothetical protein